ncbi:MAG: site-specific integrase [Verrucomicrobiota bacterium]|nr:site-specific integrase [Verrucomicrobiota bacterium]
MPRFPKIRTPEHTRRPLLTPGEFDRLLACCLSRKPTGEPLTKKWRATARLPAAAGFTGAREQEPLRLRWSHVDFKARRVFIGADEDFTATAMTIGTGGTSKNRGSRSMDFNAQLESLLREMHARRAPDSSWLFPSPQRGEKDIPAKTLRESFELVRAAAKLPRAGFHHLRMR